MTQGEYMSKRLNLFKEVPELKKIYTSKTIAEYFENRTKNLKKVMKTPENLILLDEIELFLQKRYSSEKAQEIRQELADLPLLETATHLGFMRDIGKSIPSDENQDEKYLCSLRPRLSQNILIGASLMQACQKKYHIGFYTSQISLIGNCSGGIYQLGRSYFPVNNIKKMRNSFLCGTQGMTDSYFNETILLIAKIKLLKKVLEQEEVVKVKLIRKLNQVLTPLLSTNTNYQGVLEQYNNLSSDTKIQIEDMFKTYDEKSAQINGCCFQDVEKQYHEYHSIFKEQTSLSEQVLLSQTQEIGKSLEGLGVEHIILDAVSIMSSFFIKALSDPTSIWYQIFSSEKMFRSFYEKLAVGRSAWGEEDSPFLRVHTKNGLGEVSKIQVETFDHSRENLIAHLKEGKIIPSTCLRILGTLTAGFLAHGGFFQTNYAKEFNKLFQEYLSENKANEYVENLQKIPSETMLFSLAVIKDAQGEVELLSSFQRRSLNERKKLLSQIPFMSAQKSVEMGLDIVCHLLDIEPIPPRKQIKELCNCQTSKRVTSNRHHFTLDDQSNQR